MDSFLRKFVSDIILIETKEHLTNILTTISGKETSQRPIAIDLEFDKNKNMTLIQICSGHIVYIIDGAIIDEQLSDCLYENIFNNEKFIIMIHGSASLDLPYIRKIMGDRDIGKFRSIFVDTMHMFEYIQGKVPGRKYDIYQLALYAGKISLDEKKHLDSLGRYIDKRTINMAMVKELHQVYSYVALDVILLFNSADIIINSPSFDLDREIICYTLLEKNNNVMLKARVAKYNNYYYVDGAQKIPASSVYDTWSNDNKAALDTNIRITYNPSMSSSTILLRAVFYSVLFTKKSLFRNKTEENNNEPAVFDIDMNTIFNFFRVNNMPAIHDMLVKYRSYLENIN